MGKTGVRIIEVRRERSWHGAVMALMLAAGGAATVPAPSAAEVSSSPRERAGQASERRAYARSVHRYALPDVPLVRAGGEATSLLEALGGDGAIMVNFIFTSCTTICPVLTATLDQTRKALGAEGERLRLVSISIDPEYDTPEHLADYARQVGAGPRWWFLTGKRAAIETVERAFDAFRGNKMNHAALTFIRTGPDVPWVRIEGFASARDLAREYRQLLVANP